MNDVLEGVLDSDYAFQDTDWATVEQAVRESEPSQRSPDLLGMPGSETEVKSNAIEDTLRDSSIDDTERYARAQAIRLFQQKLWPKGSASKNNPTVNGFRLSWDKGHWKWVPV